MLASFLNKLEINSPLRKLNSSMVEEEEEKR
jgi:hypothetical protein